MVITLLENTLLCKTACIIWGKFSPLFLKQLVPLLQSVQKYQQTQLSFCNIWPPYCHLKFSEGLKLNYTKSCHFKTKARNFKRLHRFLESIFEGEKLQYQWFDLLDESTDVEQLIILRFTVLISSNISLSLSLISSKILTLTKDFEIYKLQSYNQCIHPVLSSTAEKGDA